MKDALAIHIIYFLDGLDGLEGWAGLLEVGLDGEAGCGFAGGLRGGLLGPAASNIWLLLVFVVVVFLFDMI